MHQVILSDLRIISPRLLLALLAYAVLAFLAWRTMDNSNYRLVTMVILGFFAVRTVMHAMRGEQEIRHDGPQQD
ncbi:MAG TPA: hypothetical protein VFZ99_06985 [Terriglobales bacterium]